MRGDSADIAMQSLRIDDSMREPANDASGAALYDTDFLLSQAAEAAQQRRAARRRTVAVCAALTTVALLAAAALALAAGAAAAGQRRAGSGGAAGDEGGAAWGPIKKVAFGSCTAYDLRPQRVWIDGVIPSEPDAWVWLGDMAYLDEPLVDCAAVGKAGYSFPECACEATFMKRPPFQCHAGDPQHAAIRMSHQLSIPEYMAFIDFMCPPGGGAIQYPPEGSNPRQCPRPIFGTWDDHDFGWNNGDGRHPSKHAIKNIYLDAIGEPQSSPRRSTARGLQAHYSLPSAPPPSAPTSDSGPDRIDLILLDERYERETLPCATRRAWCQGVMAAAAKRPEGDPDLVWCKDLFVSGGAGGTGSCCRKDEEWAQWCVRPDAPQNPHWPHLCDPTSDVFASSPAILGRDNVTVIASDEIERAWGNPAVQGAIWRRLVEGGSSPMCEVLGAAQRRWLGGVLASSAAPLKLVVSPSVLAGSVGHPQAGYSSECDGDDWACWRPAQVNLLHTIANASGCVVVLTGDYHMSDIKVIRPGRPPGTNYSDTLQTDRLAKPVYQVMASGLSNSTARSQSLKCQGSWLEDLSGLRPLGRCSYVPQPAFGMVEVDWARRMALLQIRDGSTGLVAAGKDGSRQEVAISLDTCEMVTG